MASPPAIHSTPWRWPNRSHTGPARSPSQIAEKNQRHGLLPVPGTICVLAALVSTGSWGAAWSWSVIAIACSPHIHAATFPRLSGYAPWSPRTRPGPRCAGRVRSHWRRPSDRLRGGAHGQGGQRDEDREPGDDADHVDQRRGSLADHVGADLDDLVGGREFAELLQRAAEREPQAAEDREEEEHHDGDRLD